MSRYRPKTPIYTFTHKKKVLNSLTAVWGVEPIGIIKEAQASKMFQKMLKSLDEMGLLNRNGLSVATVGYPVGMPGSTNTFIGSSPTALSSESITTSVPSKTAFATSEISALVALSF